MKKKFRFKKALTLGLSTSLAFNTSMVLAMDNGVDDKDIQEIVDTLENSNEIVQEDTQDEVDETTQDLTEDLIQDEVDETTEDLTEDLIQDEVDETTPELTEDLIQDEVDETIEDLIEYLIQDEVDETTPELTEDLIQDEVNTNVYTLGDGLEEDNTKWSLGSGGSIVSDPTSDSRGNVLKLDATGTSSSNNLTLDTTLDITSTQNIEVSFDVYSNRDELIGDLKGGVKFFDSSNKEFARFKIENASLKPSTSLKADGTIGDYTTYSNSITADTWHNVKLVYSLDSSNTLKTAIYLDDVLVAEDLDNPFDTTDFSKLNFFLDSNTSGILYFDNISISEVVVDGDLEETADGLEEDNTKWSLGSGELVADPTDDSRGNVLKLDATGASSSNNLTLDTALDITSTQNIEVSFDVYSNRDELIGDLKGGVKFFDSSNKEFARFKIENASLKPSTSLKDDGIIGNYTTYNNKIDADTWHNVKLVYSLDSSDTLKTAIYLDDVLVAEDLGNPFDTTDFSKLNFFLDSNTSGIFYFDNISISEVVVEAPPEEPPVEDFLEYTLGWSGDTAVIDSEDEDGNTYKNTILKVEAGTSGVANHAPIDVSELGDEFTLSFKMMSDRDATADTTLNGGYKLYVGGSVTSAKEVARFLVENKTMKYTNQTSTANEGSSLSAKYTTLGVNLEANEWEEIVHIFKKVDGTYYVDAYLNGTPLNDSSIELPQRTEFDNMFTNLSFYTNSNQVGTFYYDEILLEAGAIVPEPPYVEPVDPTIQTTKPVLDTIPDMPSPVAYPESNVYGAGLNGYDIIEVTAPTKTIDVTTLGVTSTLGSGTASDGSNYALAEDDVTAKVQELINNAEAGTALYFPAGTYNFVTSSSTILTLKSGVSIIGDENGGTIFKARILDDNATVTFMSGVAVKDLAVRDITFTSLFYGEYPDPIDKGALGVNQDQMGSYANGIRIDYNTGTGEASSQLEFTGLTFENYSTMAIRLANTQDVRVKDCDFWYATDIGGGGAGYGVSIQGSNGKDNFGYEYDSMHNIVEECRFIGPYIRHGVLLQYYTHNNLVTNNLLVDTGYGSIDLHGEDEYLNEVYNNTIYNCRWGGAIELGNSGAGHDNAGPMNYVHYNTIEGGYRGIDIVYDTCDTVIENNILNDLTSSGIWIDSGDRTSVRDNTITGSVNAIYLSQNNGYTYGGLLYGGNAPNNTDIYDNTLTDCTPNYKLDAGKDNTIKDYSPVDGTIVVEKSTNAYLSAIKPEDGVEFTNLFLPDRENHTLYTNNETLTLDLVSSARNIDNIKINGNSVTTGENTINLELGENVITILVTAEDKTTTKTYTVKANRLGEGEEIPTPVISVALQENPPTIPLGRDYTIGVDVMPADATNKDITWELISGDDVISIASDGAVTTLKSGIAEVKVSSVSNPDLFVEFEVNVIESLPYQPDTNPNAIKLNAIEATATTSDASKLPQNAIDGILTSSWAGLSSVSGGEVTVPAELVIELDEPSLITHVDLYWDNADIRKGHFELYVSEDGIDYTKGFTGNSSGLTTLSESYLINEDAGLNGKFVKFVGYGNTKNGETTLNGGWNSLREVEIYGLTSIDPEIKPEVETVKQPIINETSSSLENQVVTQNKMPSNLSINLSSSHTNTLNYQWYIMNGDSPQPDTDSKATGTGSTSDTFTPPTDVIGVVEYYCVVIDTDNIENSLSATSKTAKITVEKELMEETPNESFEFTFTYKGIKYTITASIKNSKDISSSSDEYTYKVEGIFDESIQSASDVVLYGTIDDLFNINGFEDNYTNATQDKNAPSFESFILDAKNEEIDLSNLVSNDDTLVLPSTVTNLSSISIFNSQVINLDLREIDVTSNSLTVESVEVQKILLPEVIKEIDITTEASSIAVEGTNVIEASIDGENLTTITLETPELTILEVTNADKDNSLTLEVVGESTLNSVKLSGGATTGGLNVDNSAGDSNLNIEVDLDGTITDVDVDSNQKEEVDEDTLTTTSIGVEVSNVSNGTITAEVNNKEFAEKTDFSVKVGDEISLTANANSGYKFSSWDITYIDTNGAEKSVTVKSNKFEVTSSMESIIINAEFTKSSTSSGGSSGGSGGGSSLGSSSSSATTTEATTESTTIETTTGTETETTTPEIVTPEVDLSVTLKIEVNKELVNKLAGLTTVEEIEEAKDLFYALTINKYSDLKETSYGEKHWGRHAVAFCLEQGYFDGVYGTITEVGNTEAVEFGSDDNATRLEIVRVLSNMVEDISEFTYDGKFDDIEIGIEGANAIAWAVDKGITNGTSTGVFSPNSNVERQQMAVFFDRFVNELGLELPVVNSTAVTFIDSDGIYDYAKDSITKLHQAGIINGNDDGTFRPTSSISRAEFATMVENLVDLLAKQQEESGVAGLVETAEETPVAPLN